MLGGLIWGGSWGPSVMLGLFPGNGALGPGQVFLGSRPGVWEVERLSFAAMLGLGGLRGGRGLWGGAGLRAWEFFLEISSWPQRVNSLLELDSGFELLEGRPWLRKGSLFLTELCWPSVTRESMLGPEWLDFSAGGGFQICIQILYEVFTTAFSWIILCEPKFLELWSHAGHGTDGTMIKLKQWKKVPADMWDWKVWVQHACKSQKVLGRCDIPEWDGSGCSSPFLGSLALDGGTCRILLLGFELPLSLDLSDAPCFSLGGWEDCLEPFSSVSPLSKLCRFSRRPSDLLAVALRLVGVTCLSVSRSFCCSAWQTSVKPEIAETWIQELCEWPGFNQAWPKHMIGISCAWAAEAWRYGQISAQRNCLVTELC